MAFTDSCDHIDNDAGMSYKYGVKQTGQFILIVASMVG
jgi:hypothetical protein